MKINEILVESNELDEGWKDWAATGALAAGMAMGAPAADAKAAPASQVKPVAAVSQHAATKVAAMKADINKGGMGIETTNLSNNTMVEHLLQKTAIRSGIKGTELAQFMAQCSHESADFSRMKEIGGSKYFAKRYDPKTAPKTAKIIGNTRVGDGAKYFGRGFIQITGRDNYRMAGAAIGLPLEQHPELAATPEVAAKIAVWYWQTRVKPNVRNFNDTETVTKYINPALRGIQDRLQNFKEYKLAMNLR